MTSNIPCVHSFWTLAMLNTPTTFNRAILFQIIQKVILYLVYQREFQICYARSNYLCEIYKSQTVIVNAAKLFFANSPLTWRVKCQNFGEVRFKWLLKPRYIYETNLMMLMYFTWCALGKNAWTTQAFSSLKTMLAVIMAYGSTPYVGMAPK